MLSQCCGASWRAAWQVDSLFLFPIERSIELVANFEMLHHPLSAAFRFLAGHQLELARKVYATVKREWGKNKHPRDVLFTLLLEHAPPAYLERCLAIWRQLETWWAASIKANMSAAVSNRTRLVETESTEQRRASCESSVSDSPAKGEATKRVAAAEGW